jgi:hypothetical protein
MEGAKVRIAPPVVARSVGYTVQDQDHPRPSTGVSSLQSPCPIHGAIVSKSNSARKPVHTTVEAIRSSPIAATCSSSIGNGTG